MQHSLEISADITMESDAFILKIPDSICWTVHNVESIVVRCHLTTACHSQRQYYHPYDTDQRTEGRKGDLPFSKWHHTSEALQRPEHASLWLLEQSCFYYVMPEPSLSWQIYWCVAWPSQCNDSAATTLIGWNKNSDAASTDSQSLSENVHSAPLLGKGNFVL